jgi:hypothetical protein
MASTATQQMPEEDYQRLLVAARNLGKTDPDLDGRGMFVALGLLPDDHTGGFLVHVVEQVGSGKRAFAIRRAFLSETGWV